MLVQFMMKNFMSFKEEAVLDMSAIRAYKEHSCNLISYENTEEQFLRVAAIYGANAGGKTNLCRGISCFQEIILKSLNNSARNGDSVIQKYYMPFQFEQSEEPAEFQIVFLTGGYEFKYGFEYHEKGILSEWLYRKNLKTNRNTVVFERSPDEIIFGAAVRKECGHYRHQIPGETLALTFFNRIILKTKLFRQVFDAILDIHVDKDKYFENYNIIESELPQIIDHEAEKAKLVGFLNAIDAGITDIIYEKDADRISFFTEHKGRNGDDYWLGLGYESDGTLKSIVIYICARAVILQDRILVIDELNAKLHPLLLKFIIDLFYEEGSKAQLIYTTHDTTLLDKKFFRRDQVWFVQKDEYGCSQLAALSDYKVRSDSSFEKDYLAGVYGGIPMLKEFSMKGE